jgi:hypothetical protein
MPLRYKKFRRPSAGPDASIRVARWVREFIDNDEGFSVSVSASACGHAACAGDDTIIVLMRAGELPVRVKIAKPIETVTQAEIVGVLKSVFAEISLAEPCDLARAKPR